jgi:hypothetical protein
MMTDFDEMRKAVERALTLMVEAGDRVEEPDVAQLLRTTLLEAFDDLGQCLVEYGDKDLAAKLGDIAVEFEMRHTPVVGI